MPLATDHRCSGMSDLDRKARWFLRRVLGVLAATLFGAIVLSFYSTNRHNDINSINDVLITVLIGVVGLWHHVFVWGLVGFIIIGLPILAFFRWRGINSWIAFGLAGAVVGASSWLLVDGLLSGPATKRQLGTIEAIFASEHTYVFAVTGFFCGLIYWFFCFRLRPPKALRRLDTR